MSSVDNRIVKMGFENGQFTKAANATMDTLKKLGDSLKLAEGAKGLENIASKVKNVDMSSLANSVSEVSNKLSFMDIVGVTALVNIANQAVNTGKRLISSLTIDPIMDGFSEYETKMEAIQTIMTNTASKGTSLQNINDALAELNEYSDKTIYNFAQMTDNIGKATAAGVGLEDSVAFVKGMSNVAAGFGVNAQRMAGATQQMTQALASGTIRLQDWISMETAGMGGQMLQDELYATAESMGVYVDKSVPFRYTLEQNWLSSDVFLATMKRMGENESLTKAATNVTTFTKLIDTMKEAVGSGWAVSWEHIIGNKEQSTELLTSISNAFGTLVGSMADYRNEALKMWNEQGGRQAVLNGLKNILTSIKNLLGPIYNSFKKIIDPWNGERLISLSKGFEWLTEKMKISDKTAEGIGRTFDALFSIVKLVGTILSPIGALFGGVLTILSPVVEVFFSLTGALTGWINTLRETIEASELMQKVTSSITNGAKAVADFLSNLFSGTGSTLSTGIGYITEFSDKFATFVGELLTNWSGKMMEVKAYVKDFIETHDLMAKAATAVEKAVNAIRTGLENLAKFGTMALEALKGGMTSFVEFLKKGVSKTKELIDSLNKKLQSMDIQAIDLFNAGLFTALFFLVKKVYNTMKDFFASTGEFKKETIGLITDLRDVLSTYQNDLRADMLKKVAVAIAILAGSIFVLSKIDPDRLLPAVAALGGTAAGLLAALKIFSTIEPSGIKKTAASVTALIGISISLGILAGAMRKLGKMEWEDIIQSMVGLTGACTAVLMLAKTFDKYTIKPSQGVSMILLATSITILGGALAILGNLNISTIVKGVTTLGLSLNAIAFFMKSTSGVGNSVQVAVSLIPLTSSMLILAGVLAIFGNLDISTIIQGITTLSAVLIVLSGFVNSVKGVTINMFSMGTGLLLLSGALLVLTGVLGILGNMNILTLAVGLTTLGLSLGIISTGLKMMPKNTIGMATSIFILSTAMGLLAISMLGFGMMSLGTIAKGLLVIAGVLGIFGGAALLLAPAIPLMAAMAGSLALLGAATLAVSIGLTALAIGLAAFVSAVAVSGAAFAASIVAISATIPIFTSSLALGFVSFLRIINYNMPVIHSALSSFLKTIIALIIENAMPFAEACVALLLGAIYAIEQVTPRLIEAVVNIIIQVLDTLNNNLPEIASKTIEFIVNLMIAVLDMLSASIPNIGEAVLNIILAIIKTLDTMITTVVEAGVKFITSLIVSMLNAISDSIQPMVDAAVNLILSLVNGILNGLSSSIDGVVNAVIDFVIRIINSLTNAFQNRMPEVREAVKGLVRAIIEELKACVKDALSIGGDIVNGIKDGLLGGISKVTEAAKTVARNALNAAKNFLDINSPSKEFFALGKWSDIGMANGFTKYAGVVAKEATSVGRSALDSMKKSISGLANVIDSDSDINPVITPVLDLSEIQNGTRQMSDMLNTDSVVKAPLNTTRNLASRLFNTDTDNSLDQSAKANNTTNNSTVINNEFKITGNDPKEIANQVSRILQKQVERRDVVWA